MGAGRPFKIKGKLCKCGNPAARGQIYCSRECAPLGTYGQQNRQLKKTGNKPKA